MKQYRVVYTINGKGYTAKEPWIYDNASSIEEAQNVKTEAEYYLAGNYGIFEVWVEEGNLPDWHKVDLG